MADIVLKSHTTDTKNANITVLDVVDLPVEQLTFKAGAAIKAGAGVLADAAGKGQEGAATSAATANVWGIAIKSASIGQGVTVVKRGILAGFDLSALAYGAPVYLSNTTGKLADAAGTTSKVVGRVVPIYGTLPGSAPMKALYIEL